MFICPPAGLVCATDSLHLTSLDRVPRSRCQLGGNAWPQLANVSLFVCAKVTLRINRIPWYPGKITEKKKLWSSDVSHLSVQTSSASSNSPISIKRYVVHKAPHQTNDQ